MSKNTRKRKRRLFPLILFLMPVIALGVLIFGVLSIISSRGDCEVSSSSSSSTVTSTTSSLASDSDWTYPGSTANKNAEKIFMAFVNRGTTGAFAAGVVGWVNSEGGFAMVGRAEGHYGTKLEENSIAYGVVPVGLSYYTTEAGGGIFQFTPYTKYAPLGSPDWEDIDKMVNFVMGQMNLGDWNPAMDLTGKNHSFREAVKLTDPQEATLTWQAYERGNVLYINQDQKKSDAQKAYEMFDGAKYSYDEVKFNQAFGGSSSGESDQAKVTTSSQSKCSSKSKGGSSSLLAAKDMAHLFDEPYRVAQPFGPTPWSTGAGRYLYPTGEHTGLDLIPVADPDSRDVPVYAVADGVVADGVYNSINGNYIWQTMPDGNYLYYGHLRYTPLVKVGDKIKKGQQIGVVGQSGSAQGILTHVHLEYARTVSYFQNYQDPSPLIIENGTLKQDQIIDPRAK